VKNNLIAFYKTILAYLIIDIEFDNTISVILDLFRKSSPSWEATEESIRKLQECVNYPSLVEDDSDWSTTLNDFIKSAFKDLSILKNPEAMELFDELAKKCLPTFRHGEDMFIWARTIKERVGGSAVIVLHVSDLERFRKIIEEHDLVDGSTECYTLEECIQLGS
jgi:hypothetical protein